MKKHIFTSLSVASLLFVTSCKTDFDQDVASIKPTAGNADFSNYISLGNSLTSGYRDGALYAAGQNESYPSMIAAQMKLAGGGAFVQPLMSDDNGGLILGGKEIANTKLVIKSFTNGAPDLVYANNNVSTTDPTKVLKGPFNNMGVPGAKVAHLLAPGYGNPTGIGSTANPYFVRFASSPTTSVIADFLSQKPTFFSLWIGNNDALLYALAGADDTQESLTPADQFKTYYNMLIAQIVASKAKGVIANIPDVTTIPSLTTVPYNPLTASVLGGGDVNVGNANIDQLNANLYGPLSQILATLGAGDRIKPLSKTAPNPLLIVDENLPNMGANITKAALASGNPTLMALSGYLGAVYGQARQAKAGDLVPLTTKAAIGATVTLPTGIPASLGSNGIAYPFADKYVLTSTEVSTISTAIASYNSVIQAAATANGYAFVDANAMMKKLASDSGIQWDGVKYTATFITGGAFSLDGVHLTGRGYAVIANEFINQINATYKSTLPQVNVNNYSGVKFP